MSRPDLMFVMFQKNFSFIEAPVYQGQKHFGVSLGPSFLRQVLVDQNFQFDFLHLAERQSTDKISNSIYEELSYLTERESRRGKLMFVAGGDHSLSIGSIQGLLRVNPNLKVLWIDAHGDVNTTSTSVTKSFHGMPLSFLLGIDSFFQKSEWFEETLKPENLIYVGLRDLEKSEKLFLDRFKIQHFSADQFKKDSHFVVKEIQRSLKENQVHISLDSDAFDPSIAPSTGVPVKEGLLYSDVENLVENVLNVAIVSSFEYVELNPQIFKIQQDVFQTAQLGIEIFKLVLKTHLKKQQQSGGKNGIYDRFSYSKGSGLHDPYFEMEP